MQSFDLCHANQLSVSDAKEYIKRYFYPLSSGLHIQVDYEDESQYMKSKKIKLLRVFISIVFQKLFMTFISKNMIKLKLLLVRSINHLYLVNLLILVRLYFMK